MNNFNPQQPSNLNTTGSNKTTNYFNNFYSDLSGVSSGINDSVVSFFEQQTGNTESAKLLAQAVIDTAKSNKEDPLVVLDQFQKLNAGQLNVILSLYLNTSRVNTSLLGITNVPKSSEFVTRTIINF